MPATAGEDTAFPLRGALLSKTLRWLLIAAMLFAIADYVLTTVHWPIALDTPVMHYINFLIRHGARPYVDIADNNMPGAYYIEGFAMRVFGGSDLSWRFYDFFLLGCMTLGLLAIAAPYDWAAGLIALGLFLSLHGTEGPSFSVEREQVIAVLLVLGYAALFGAVRRHTPAWMLAFGVATGLATSIKPTYAVLPFALLLMVSFTLRKRGDKIATYVLAALGGLVLVFAFDLGYLLHYGALHGFVFIMAHAVPAYSAMRRVSFVHLVTSWNRSMSAMLLGALVLGILGWRQGKRWTWEQGALAVGAAFALLSYFAQGKGFVHHRYPALVLLLLLAGMELLRSLREGPSRPLAWALAAFVLVWIVPSDAAALRRVDPNSPFTTALEHDLVRLGGTTALGGKVQCFDMVYGCLNALYHLDLVENIPFTGDMLLFSDPPGESTLSGQATFWRLTARDPADILVVSNESLQYGNSYTKIEHWPDFDCFLASKYALRVERTFPMREGSMLPANDQNREPHDSYRIYVRKGTPFISVPLE